MKFYQMIVSFNYYSAFLSRYFEGLQKTWEGVLCSKLHLNS